MKPVRRIGIVNGGGDAPGLNPVVLRRFSLIVVAAGVKLSATDPCGKPIPSTASGSVANTLAFILRERPQKKICVAVPGHVRRVGSPGALGRVPGTRLGVAATRPMAKQRFAHAVCLKGSKIDSVALDEALEKIVDPACESVPAARAAGATFGDSA